MAEPKGQDSDAFYRGILKANGISTPVAAVIVEESEVKDDGFLSDREFVTIKFEDANVRPIYLFTKKRLTGNSSNIEISQNGKVFEKESIFLTKYVPAVMEMLKQKGIDESYATEIYPKCYYGDESRIVLENIVREQGYETVGKEEPHNYETTIVALKTLATHHALSHAMIQEGGGPDKLFQRFPYLNYESIGEKAFLGAYEPWLHSLVTANFKILELNSGVDGASETAALIKAFNARAPTLMELHFKPLDKEEGEVHFLNHGDFWYCNMMFLKDKNTGKFIGHKALDFQIVHHNCPSLDLLFYFFTTVATEVRQNLLKDLFEVYLAQLNKFSEELGHPINMTYDQLERQYRKKMQYGLVASFFFQYGPGLGILKGTDIMSLETSQWGPTLDRLSTEWIQENPDQARKHAEKLVKVMKEFKELEIR